MSESKGTFGSNRNRGTQAPQRPERDRTDERPRRTRRERSSVGDFFSGISPERWVDIICCTLFAAFVIAVICNWEKLSLWLFESVLFPFVELGSGLVFSAATILLTIGGLYLLVRGLLRRWF